MLAQPEVEASHASAPLAGGEEGSDIAPQKEESHSSVTEATPAVDPSASTDETEKSEKTDIGGEDAEDEQPEIIPPTVDVDLLDRLSRWTSGQGASLRKAGLGELSCYWTQPTPDPAEYSYIALLAGTSAYLPRAQVRALRDAEQASEKVSFILSLAELTPALPLFAVTPLRNPATDFRLRVSTTDPTPVDDSEHSLLGFRMRVRSVRCCYHGRGVEPRECRSACCCRRRHRWRSGRGHRVPIQETG